MRKVLKCCVFTKRKTLQTGVRLLYWPRITRHLRHVHFLLMPCQLWQAILEKNQFFSDTINFDLTPPPPHQKGTCLRPNFKAKTITWSVWILVIPPPLLLWKISEQMKKKFLKKCPNSSTEKRKEKKFGMAFLNQGCCRPRTIRLVYLCLPLSTLQFTALQINKFVCSVLHYTALHCTTQYTAIHCNEYWKHFPRQ